MKHQRVRTILLAALLVTACLIGQTVAVGAASPGEVRGSGTITRGETPAVPAGPKPATVQPQAKLTVTTPSSTGAVEVGKPAVERALPSRAGWTEMMSEDFEDVWPSGAWTTYDDNGSLGGEVCWDDENWIAYTGDWSAWGAGGCANGLDPNLYYYPPDVDSWMVYGPFDLSDATSAYFDFYYWNNSEVDYDPFWWAASGDDIDYLGYYVWGDSGGWQYAYLDLSDYLGDSTVWLAFVFRSDFIFEYDGPFVDHVSLWKETGGGGGMADWTYMVYLDGDNNLEPFAVDDFLEMSSVGSTGDVNIVVQMDRVPGFDTLYDNWTDTRRFLVTTGMTPSAANGTTIGEANMGDPATLVDFVGWAMATYPADHYALVLWDHGSGWRARALDQPSVQGIAYDDSSGGDGLEMDELPGALNTLTGGGATPFDLLGMDACLMAMIEVDNQLRPYAGVRAGSQETEPGDGWPFDTILAALVADPAMTAETLGTVIVDGYYASYGNDETQSTVRLGGAYDTLNAAVDAFAAALIADGAANIAGIETARNLVQVFTYDEYMDLRDFAELVRDNVGSAAIDNAATAVMSAVDAAVIHEHSGGYWWPDAYGISIYMPRTALEYDPRYDGSAGFLQFTAATQWDEWVHAYHAYLSGPAPGNDDFDAATIIGSVPYTTTQDTSGATTAGDDPSFTCVSGPKNRSVWFRYTAPATQTLGIDTFGSDYDTVLGVWTGSRGSLTSVACNDDRFSLQSQVVVPVSAGTTYYIEVASYWAEAGQLTLRLGTVQETSFRSLGAGDGWVLERDETSGKGGSFDAAATTARVGDNALDYQYRSILDFDTAALPDGAVIVGVTVRIKRESVVGTNPMPAASGFGFLTVDQKMGAFHDNPALEILDFHAIGNRGNVGRFVRTPAAGWYRAPLREPSYFLVNLTGHTQFRLRFQTDDNDNMSADYLSFFTGNTPTFTDRPELVITYYAP